MTLGVGARNSFNGVIKNVINIININAGSAPLDQLMRSLINDHPRTVRTFKDMSSIYYIDEYF